MNRLTGSAFAASLCAVILYTVIQNTESMTGFSAENILLWAVIGIAFLAIEKYCSVKLALPRWYSFLLIYAAAPLLMSACAMKGINGFVYAETMLVIPAAAVHIILILAFFGLKKGRREG